MRPINQEDSIKYTINLSDEKWRGPNKYQNGNVSINDPRNIENNVIPFLKLNYIKENIDKKISINRANLDELYKKDIDHRFVRESKPDNTKEAHINIWDRLKIDDLPDCKFKEQLSKLNSLECWIDPTSKVKYFYHPYSYTVIPVEDVFKKLESLQSKLDEDFKNTSVGAIRQHLQTRRLHLNNVASKLDYLMNPTQFRK